MFQRNLTVIKIFVFLALVLIPFAVSADAIIETQIQIPILGQRSITVCRNDTCTGIAEYIALIYKWLVGFAAILAVLALSWGGVRWLTSGGESGKIQEAQKTIGNAIIGLMIALLSYVGLAVINPAFVQFKPLTIPGIKKIKFDIKGHVASHAALGEELGKTSGVPISGFTNVKFSGGRCNPEKDVTSSGVLTKLLVDLLHDIDKAGFDVTVTCIVSGHGTTSTFHNPDGRAADIAGNQATVVRLADYLGANSARLQVNELFYAYNTDQTYDGCKEQDSGWLQRTKTTYTNKEKKKVTTTLYETHKNHLHVAVGGCKSGSK